MTSENAYRRTYLTVEDILRKVQSLEFRFGRFMRGSQIDAWRDSRRDFNGLLDLEDRIIAMTLRVLRGYREQEVVGRKLPDFETYLRHWTAANRFSPSVDYSARAELARILGQPEFLRMCPGSYEWHPDQQFTRPKRRRVVVPPTSVPV